MRRMLLAAGSLAVLMTLAGCASPVETGSTIPEAPPTTASASAAASTSAADPDTSGPESPASDVAGMQAPVVRFTLGETSVDVTIKPDNPTARDFLSMLPLTLPIEEFAGREKLGDLPRELVTEGSPGSDPEDGDLIYYKPWGNLGFYYNTDGIGYSDQTIHLGTYEATLEQLKRLEGNNATVELVD